MRFLIDQNLPTCFAEWLTDHEQEAFHVRLLGLAEAADGVIPARAIQTGAIMVSKDADFAAANAAGLQVVWVRLGNAKNERLIAVWSAAWPSINAALQAGEKVVELYPE